MNRLVLPALAAAALAMPAPAGVNYIWNSSMEFGPGPNGANENLALDWTFFGSTVERSSQENLEPPGGGWSLKIFGGDPTTGGYQDVAVSAGEDVTIRAMLYTRGDDRVGGDAAAKIKLEFFDANDQPIGAGTEITVLDANSPANVWTLGQIGPVVAPGGTAYARMVCVWTYSSQSLGSAYWDDCQMSIDGGPDVLSNGDFEEPGFGSGNNPFGIDHWTGFGTQEKSDDHAYRGDFSAKLIVGDSATYSGLYQDFGEFAAGDRLYLHGMVYNPSVGGLNGTAAAAIKLEFFPAGGSNAPPPEQALDFDENAPVDTWELVSYTTVVPDDITLARIVMVADDTSDQNGPVYFDSAVAERSTIPGVNQLQNASFEQGTSGPNGLTNWTEFRGISCTARKNAFEVPANDGSSVLKISGSCVAGIYQEISVTPGELLTISAMLRSRAADPFNDPAASAGVKVEWRSGVVPPQIDIGGAPNNTIRADAPTDTWIPIFIDFTMPPGTAANARFTIIAARGDASSAQVYFDVCQTGEVLQRRAAGGISGTARRVPAP